jgi:(p)ppGpp synthase/HD superfamily hydrolase
MAVQMANCCHPIPDDPIVGHIRKGQGLAVHQAECIHALRARKADPDRWLELTWARDPSTFFTVGLDVSAVNERGVLGRIAVAIAEAESNILNVHVDDEDARIALIHFKVQVRDRTHLARVIRTLRRVKLVVRVVRPRGGTRSHPQDAA